MSAAAAGTAAQWLDAVADKYHLPEGHLDYFRGDVEDAFEHVRPAARAAALERVETAARTAEYVIERKVGNTSTGPVYVGHSRDTGQRVTIRIIDLEESYPDVAAIQREMQALPLCPQLTRCYGSQVLRDKLWVVTEYVDGGSVRDILKKRALEERVIAIVAREVLIGLQVLHDHTKRGHRDVQAASIRLSRDGHVKLAECRHETRIQNMIVQNLYVEALHWKAPEALTQNRCDAKADVWSLGITCIEMANRKPPRYDMHPLQVVTVIPTQPAPRLEGEQWSRAFRHFVAVCLVKDPRKRPTIAMLLRHPFVARAGPVSDIAGVWDAEEDPAGPGE